MFAGAATFASGGLAAPFVIASLTSIGTACSVGGGAWSIKNEVERGKRNSDTQREIIQQLEKDVEAQKEMNDILNSIEKGDFGEPSRVFRQLHTILAGLGGIGIIYGSAAAIDILRLALPALAYFLTGSTHAVVLSLLQYLPIISGKGALEGMEEVAEQSASLAVKGMYDGFSKDFVRREATKAAHKAYKEVSQKVYKEVLEETMEKAAKQAAKRAAEEVGSTAAKESAKKAAKEAAKEAAAAAAKESGRKAARDVASKVAQQQAKIAARATGMITIGFGALSSLWEGYNAYYNHYASQEGSELGNELRSLADKLQNA
jgi:hypothetical protein